MTTAKLVKSDAWVTTGYWTKRDSSSSSLLRLGHVSNWSDSGGCETGCVRAPRPSSLPSLRRGPTQVRWAWEFGKIHKPHQSRAIGRRGEMPRTPTPHPPRPLGGLISPRRVHHVMRGQRGPTVWGQHVSFGVDKLNFLGTQHWN